MPLCSPASMVTYTRRGSLGATASPMRPSPSAKVGSPLMIAFQVLPPSVDLNSPLPGPCQTPFSHGPWRASHVARYRVLGSFTAKVTSMAPVFTSLYQTFWYERPPSVERKRPRSSLGPY